MRRTFLLSVSMLFGAGALFPCGGPESFDIAAPLQRAPEFANALLYPYDGYEAAVRSEIRFSYGLLLADSVRFAAMDLAAHQGGWPSADTATVGAEPVSAAALDNAITRNDLATAEREAKNVVHALLSLPAPMASNGVRQLRRAVELLDFMPTLRAAPAASMSAVLASSGGEVRRLTPQMIDAYAAAHPAHPRVAAVRALALSQHIAARVPNGWLDDMRKGMTPAAWDSLQAEHVQWLADFPTHPLATLVQAERVRLWYWQGKNDEAWCQLLLLYRTVPARAAYDMRHLLLNGVFPPAGFLADAAVPVELRAAMIGTLNPSRAEWSLLWKRSTETSNRRFGENLQERLLASLASDSAWSGAALPPEMPSYRPDASAIWRQLWAIAQLRTGHPAAALQLATPKTADSLRITSRILARAHLELSQWSRAAAVPELQPEARIFLIHVMAPDSTLATLRASTDTGARSDALHASVARSAAAGDWSRAAALTAPIDRARGARFRRAAALAADTSTAGHLAFARWLTAQRHSLFQVSWDDVIWYRSLSWRRWDLTAAAPDATPDLPWTPKEELAATDAHFRTTSEDWYALVEYRKFFEQTRAGHPQRRAAVREANAAYRRLVDYGRNTGLFWADVLPTSPEAIAIREAGRSR